MPWLLDGNNLARGRDRGFVRRAALAMARSERVRILVFFDGAPPPGAATSEKLGPVEVRYAKHADTAILAFLGNSRQGWRLATDDRDLGRAARAARAEVVPAASFWRKAKAALQASGSAEDRVSDVGAELAYLADEGHRLPKKPARVRRRRARMRRE
jgi:hypothetical protein